METICDEMMFLPFSEMRRDLFKVLPETEIEVLPEKIQTVIDDLKDLDLEFITKINIQRCQQDIAFWAHN